MTEQAPLQSKFGAASTAAEIIQGHNLYGKVAVVTGGYSGIGLEVARLMAQAGAKVILPARNPEKAQTAIEPYADLNMEIVPMNLMDPESITAFSQWFAQTGQSLDILINNAAIMACPLIRDDRGFEAQFSTNHLGHFQLTVGLWPALRMAGTSRVVTVSSRGHFRGQVDFDDPNFMSRAYDQWEAYGQSKSANALFAMAVDRRGQSDGIRAFSLHPGGIVSTNLAQFMTDDQIKATGFVDDNGIPIIDPENGKKNIYQGAVTTMWCAISPELEDKGGVYCEDCNIAPITITDQGVRKGVRPWACDADIAERLWKLSEELTGFGLS